jgi:hypothetical protein
MTSGKTNKAKPWTQAREVRQDKELAELAFESDKDAAVGWMFREEILSHVDR